MPTALSSRFGDDPQSHGASWSKLWQEECTPWDKGEPSPALVDLIEERRITFAPLMPAGELPIRGRIALIPGCGRGYDVAYLSRALERDGFDQVIGLDLSSKAVETASTYLHDCGAPASASVRLEDFFDPRTLDTWRNRIDLIYDYTFLCALHPAQRSAWANRMTDLLRPGGVLVTLQRKASKFRHLFVEHTDKKKDPLDSHEGGPPFSLSEEIYNDLLLSNFDTIISERPRRNFTTSNSEKDNLAVYRRHIMS